MGYPAGWQAEKGKTMREVILEGLKWYIRPGGDDRH
jgi:hypothetical protein